MSFVDNTRDRMIARRKRRRSRRALEASLTLTSLVDVFTVLVIYLLVSTAFGEKDLKLNKDIQLPKASHSEGLISSLVIEVKGSRVYIDEKRISLSKLTDLLIEKKEDYKALLIQADQRTSYFRLNPVILSGMNAGFTNIQFAVLQEESSS